MRKQRRVSADRITASEPAAPTVRFFDRIRVSTKLLLGLLLFAATLRFALPARIAVEHFDAGVYASGAFFTESLGSEYPGRFLYAPPLLPAIAKICVVVFSLLNAEGEPWRASPALPVLLSSLLTVWLVFRFAERSFSLTIGIAAALLAATSDLHITLSREVLTDVPTLAFMIIAIVLYASTGDILVDKPTDDAIDDNPPEPSIPLARSFGFAVAAGAATALARWTKYSGWIPIVITIAGSAAFAFNLLLASQKRRTLLVAGWIMLLWLAMNLTAGALWSPVMLGLDDVGGYSVVAQNHAGYKRGFDQWLPTASQQLANLVALQSPIGMLGFAAMVFVVAHRISISLRLLAAAIAFTLASFAGVVPLCALLAIASLLHAVSLLLRRQPEVISLAQWLLIAWFLALAMATPTYHPYPRLALPWVAACWLLAPLGLAASFTWITKTCGERFPSLPNKAGFAIAATIFLATLFLKPDTWSQWPAWDDRSQLAGVAQQIANDVRSDQQANDPVVLVYGEPALFYHLRAAGKVDVWPIAGDLAETYNTDSDVYIAAGPHALETEAFRNAIANSPPDRIKPIGDYSARMSVHVALNRHNPSELATHPNRRNYEYRLYKITKP